jgi:membrane protease YdiL (CAAX protease family)
LPSLIAVAFILYRESPRRLFAPPRGGIVRSLGCVGVALLSFFVLSSGLRVLWVRLHGAAGRPLPIVPEGLWWPDVALLAALGHYLIVAVVEEAVHRGVLQETIRHYLPSWMAVLSVSLLFGVIHVRPLGATLPLVAFGAVAGVLVLRFRSLLPAVVLHWAVNFLAHLLRVSQ